MRNCIAHRTDDDIRQPLRQHLENVALIASEFAKAFGAGDLAYVIGLAHDLGKYSEAFQERINGANIQVDHSTAGAQCLYSVNNNLLGLIAAYCIAGHHSGLPDGGSSQDDSDDSTLHGRLKKVVEDYSEFENEVALAILTEPLLSIDDAFDYAFFVRMMFSTLVDADWLDTEQFFNGGISRTRGSGSTISELNAKLSKGIAKYLNPSQDTSELNLLRTDLLRDCVYAAENEQGLFTLTAPTGSGKTLSSLAFSLAHADRYNLRRVIYVVPYNTIIEQNAGVFEEYLGLENVLQHHSNVNYDSEENDGTSNSCKRYSVENWDYPVIVTSSVQFFESLFASRSSKCRKLHNIVGSVIVFDEAQMIPQPLLRPCIAAIQELVRNYGCSAVLATATQASLDKYFNQIESCEIARAPEALHEAFRRTILTPIKEKLSNENLAGRLRQYEQVLCVVNTRKYAQEVFALLEGQDVFHLSTTMYAKHRARVLAEVKQRLRAGEPCRVVSTSMIEAGVDIDFPIVFREIAGLDSVVQAAGRCNREGKHEASVSKVFVFSSSEHEPPKSMRTAIGAFEQVAKRYSDLASPEAVMAYFDQLFYDKGDDALDAKEVLKRIERGGRSGNYPFRQIAEEVKIIDGNMRSVFVLFEEQEYEEYLRKGKRSRALFREIGKYEVSLYQHEIQRLLDVGAIEMLDSEVLLLDKQYYHDRFGVELSAQTRKNLII